MTPAGHDGSVSSGLPLPIRAAVFASGSGSNLQSLLDAEPRGAPWSVRLLVCDREDAGALNRAGAAGVDTRIVRSSGRDPAAVGAEILQALEDAAVQVVFLAGYLRLLPPSVVAAYPRRILNVHPALLPSFGGKGMYGRHVHEAVLAAGCRISGATVHFVDERFDEGSILAQWPVPVLPGDTAAELAARVLAVEHRLYPLAAGHLCRALAAGREPEPFVPGPQDFALAGDPTYSTIEDLFQEAFSKP